MASGPLILLSPIRDFSKKAPARKEDLEINEAILEIMTLTRLATSEHSVLLKMRLSEGLPHILGDRVPTATGDPQPDHERHRGDERDQGKGRAIC